MIELEVLEDIRSYKSKVLGPLTLHQAIADGICFVLDFFVILTVIKPFHLPIDIIIWICIIPDALVYGFVAGTVMGMIPMRKFIKKALIYNTLAPKNRKAKNPSIWKNVTTFENIETKKVKLLSKELKQHPEYIAYK